jgi:hypothetical protein
MTTSDTHAVEGAIGLKENLEVVPAELGVEILQKSCIPQQCIPQSGGDKTHNGRPLVGFQEAVGDPQLNAGILAADRLRTSHDSQITLFSLAEVDADEGCDLVLENGVVRAGIQQRVA